MDMHSGGGAKLPPWEHIYLEAPQAEAEEIFRLATGRDPENVTCDCCGEDYSVSEAETLEEVSSFWRGENRTWATTSRPLTVEEYGRREDIIYVTAAEIDAARRGTHPLGSGPALLEEAR